MPCRARARDATGTQAPAGCWDKRESPGRAAKRRRPCSMVPRQKPTAQRGCHTKGRAERYGLAWHPPGALRGACQASGRLGRLLAERRAKAAPKHAKAFARCGWHCLYHRPRVPCHPRSALHASSGPGRVPKPAAQLHASYAALGWPRRTSAPPTAGQPWGTQSPLARATPAAQGMASLRSGGAQRRAARASAGRPGHS